MFSASKKDIRNVQALRFQVVKNRDEKNGPSVRTTNAKAGTRRFLVIVAVQVNCRGLCKKECPGWESNPGWTLKARKLFILHNARNAENAKMPHSGYAAATLTTSCRLAVK
jgi:hypothetical protein